MDLVTRDLEKLWNLMTVPILVWDESEKRAKVNKAAIDNFDIQRFDAVDFTFIHPDDLAIVLAQWQEALQNGSLKVALEVRIRVRSGDFRWYQLDMCKIPETNCWVSTFVDTTSRHIVEDLNNKYSYQLKLFETVMQQLPVAVIVAEAPSGKLLFGNDKMRQVWRQPLVKSASIADYVDWIGFHIDGQRYENEEWPMARTIMTGEVIESEVIQIFRGDGSRSFIAVSAAPIRNPEGVIIAGVTVLESLDEKMKLDEERIKALSEAQLAQEQSRFKSSFLANVSHDIRTPINGVMGLASLLYLTHLTDEQKAFIDDIMLSCRQLVNLVDDILDITKIEAGKFELQVKAFSLADVINAVMMIVRASMITYDKTLSLAVEQDDALNGISLVGDPKRVAQILSNLMSNAVKFTPSGGHVKLSVRRVPLVQGGEGLVHVQFEVIDDGIGISDELKRRLFTAFEQGGQQDKRSSFHGSGLGLHIVHRLVELMHGTVSVTSTLGQGSTFTVVLPFTQAPLSLTETPTHVMPALRVKTKAERQAKRLLLAEDNKVSAMIAMRLMKEEGYDKIKWVTNGQEAIDAFHQETYDAILMDCQMPVMSGYEAARLLRQQGVTVPIIAFTASATTDEEHMIYESGMNDVVYKPFKPSELREKLDDWID